MILLAVALCGVTFHLPPHWTAKIETDDEDRQEHIRCSIAIRPPHYARQYAKTQWSAEDPPMTLDLYDSSFDEAMTSMEFEKDDEGNVSVPSRGANVSASEFKFAGWTGWRGDSWYRGYAHDDAELAEGESRVFTGQMLRLAVRRGKRMVGVYCIGGVYESPFNCDQVTKRLLRTLR